MRRVLPVVLVTLTVASASLARPTTPVGEGVPAGDILFTRTDEKNGRPHLYVMAADGSHVRLFVRNASEAAVSPDGRRIAFVREDSIWIMQRDATRQRRLTAIDGQVKARTDSSPAWSPDGTSVYFSRVESSRVVGSIFSVRADGTRLRRLAGPVGEWDEWCADDPAPSPDGRLVAYGVTDCLHGGAGGIEAIDVRSRKPRPILQHFPGVKAGRYWSLWGFDAAWSTDGRIALAVIDLSGRDHEQSGIWVARPDGSRARRVWDASGSVPGIPWPSGWPSAPAWSPDGRWLTFVSDVSLPLDYAGEIIVSRPDGSGLRSVTRTRTIDEEAPVWLPKDGR